MLPLLLLSSKVMYFSSIFPYVVLLCFLIRGLMLEGAAEGIKYMFYPKVSSSPTQHTACMNDSYKGKERWGGAYDNLANTTTYSVILGLLKHTLINKPFYCIFLTV